MSDKCPCGNPATGSVNNHFFCNKTECIQTAITAVAEPIVKALATAKEEG